MEAEEVKSSEEYAVLALPLRPQSSTHIRRNPSQGSAHSKRTLPISSEPHFQSEKMYNLEEETAGEAQESDVNDRKKSKEAFEIWLANKEKAREQAKLAAQVQAQAAKAAAYAKEQLKREALQMWTERLEAKLQEKRNNALHRQQIEQVLVESERIKAREREQLCKQYYQKWLRDKASERESAVKWGPGQYRKARNRPFLSVELSTPPAKHRLTLSTFQISILPSRSPLKRR